MNWIYLSSSSSHSSLYSAQNVLKEQFNININDVLSRDFNVKQQFWCDFETKVTAHWENEMVESTPWTYEQVTEKKLNYCFQNSPYLKANIKKIPHANLLSKEMIGVGHGMMSSMCRLKLQWEKQNNLLPTSVVCKLTPTTILFFVHIYSSNCSASNFILIKIIKDLDNIIKNGLYIIKIQNNLFE